MKALLTLAALFLATQAVKAEAPVDEADSPPFDTIARIYQGMAEDYARCAAFYRQVSQCFAEKGSGTSQRFDKLSADSLDYAASYLGVSQSLWYKRAGKPFDRQELQRAARETAHEWFARAQEEMLAEMGDCARVGRLNASYLKNCNAYYEDPGLLEEKWVWKLTVEP